MRILESYSSIRQKPVNLKDSDLALFENEFEKTFNEVHIIELSNVVALSEVLVLKGIKSVSEINIKTVYNSNLKFIVTFLRKKYKNWIARIG